MNTDDLVTHSRARFDSHVKRKILKEKYESKLLFAYNGGMFRATPEMITFLSLYGDQDVVVPDLYDNPIKFTASKMCTIMRAKWQEQMNAWLVEHASLEQQQ